MRVHRVPADAEGQVPMAGPMINADGGYLALEHPAGDGVPEVNWAVQFEGNQNLPVFIPDQGMAGEYGGEYGNAFADAGEGIPPVFDLEGFDDFVEHVINLFAQGEAVDELFQPLILMAENDDNSLDSGYGSMSESEEQEEDDEGEDFGRGSPLHQEFPPDEFWQDRRQVDPSVVVSPRVQAGPPSAGPLVPAPGPAGPSVPADPPVSAGPVQEEPAPSTSGLGSSTKRSREESPAAQQRAKRQRTDNGDEDDEQPSTSSGPSVPADPPVSAGPVQEEPAPSTSGLGSSTKRSREESPAAQQREKRQRMDNGYVDDEQPSTSTGLRSVWGYWPAPYNGSDSDDSDSD